MGKFTKTSTPSDFFYADKGNVQASSTPTMSQKVSKKAKRAKFDPEQQAVIGRQLQALYDEVVNQALPEKLQDLLGTLDQPSKKNGQ